MEASFSPNPAPTPSPAPTPAPTPTPSIQDVNTAAPPINNAVANVIPKVAQAAHQKGKMDAVRGFMGHLFGAPMDYSVNEKGETVATPVNQKPGQLFRSILGGAILGMAGGAQSRTFAGGVGMGGAAVQERNQRLDEQRYQRAREDFENKLKSKADSRAEEEFKQNKLRNDAVIALSNQQLIAASRANDFTSPDRVEEHNKQSLALENFYHSEFHGSANPIVVNGKNVNDGSLHANDMMAAKIKDGSAFKPPEGFHRITISRYDTAGLNYEQDPKTGRSRWIDAQGNPVDMNSRQFIQFYDVPDKDMNSARKTKGSEVQNLLGKELGKAYAPDANADYYLSPAEALTLATKGLEARRMGQDIDLKYQDLKYKQQEINLMLSKENRQDVLNNSNLIRDQIQAAKTLLSDITLPADQRDEARKDLQDAEKRLNDLLTTQPNANKPAAGGTTPKTPTTPADAQAAALTDPVVKNVVDTVQKTNSVPRDYAGVESIPALTTDGQRVGAAVALGIPVSVEAVQRMAQARGISPDALKAQLEAAGAKVAAPAAEPEQNVKNP